jgi:carboxymethylenebutenolidase
VTLAGEVLDPEKLVTEQLHLDTRAGGVDAYFVQAKGEGPAPSLIVIHEGFGLNEHIRDVCRRFANAGYNALAPDLYTRVGTPNPDDIPAVLATVFGLPDAGVVLDLEDSAAFLRSRKQATQKVGVIGFCSGGRLALLLASSSQSVDAAADCWGGFTRVADLTNERSEAHPTPVVELAGGLACPLLVARGTEDRNPSAEDVAILLDRAKPSGQPIEVHEFDGATHGFFADDRASYHEEASFKLWPIVLGFLGRTLLTGPAK